MATATGGRTATRIGGALVVVLVVALIASQCTSTNDPTPPIGIGQGGTGEVLALGAPGVKIT